MSDPSLRKCFDKAKKRDFRKVKNERWQLYIKDATLFRYFVTEISHFKQLVVPTKFRTQVLQTGYDSIFYGNFGPSENIGTYPITDLLAKYCDRCNRIRTVVSCVSENGENRYSSTCPNSGIFYAIPTVSKKSQLFWSANFTLLRPTTHISFAWRIYACIGLKHSC